VSAQMTLECRLLERHPSMGWGSETEPEFLNYFDNGVPFVPKSSRAGIAA